MVRSLRKGLLTLLGLLLLAGATPAQEAATPEGLLQEEATTALISARVEIFSLMVDQRKKKEALAELDAITAIRNIGESPEAQEVMLSAYLEGVEFLIELGEHRRAESLGKQGLERFKDSDLHRGYFLMSLANVYKRRGEAARALEALREATALFEKVRKKE